MHRPAYTFKHAFNESRHTTPIDRPPDWRLLQRFLQERFNIALAVEPIEIWRTALTRDTVPANLLFELDGLRHFERRASRLAGRVSARRALHSFVPQATDAQSSIISLSSGRPAFRCYPEMNLSIAHSDAHAVACVGQKPCGIDMERIEERPQSFLRFFFSKEEQEWIRTTEATSAAAANMLWTRKEAISKLIGKGGHIPFKSIPVLRDKCDFDLYSYVVEGYAISLALFH